MSIQNITTAFNHVSVGPYVVDEFWVNSGGLSATTAGSTLAFPGVYGQGVTIQSVSLIAPGVSGGVNTVLGGQSVSLYAFNNSQNTMSVYNATQSARVLYTALGTLSNSPGNGLGLTLPAESWLVGQLNSASAGPSGQTLGVVVKYTTLSQERESLY
jgi:hypothetical protein